MKPVLLALKKELEEELKLKWKKLKEAVIEANALIKQSELESQSYRAKIEDAVDNKMEEIQNKINQLNEFLDQERSKLRQPRDIDKPQQ